MNQNHDQVSKVLKAERRHQPTPELERHMQKYRLALSVWPRVVGRNGEEHKEEEEQMTGGVIFPMGAVRSSLYDSRKCGTHYGSDRAGTQI